MEMKEDDILVFILILVIILILILVLERTNGGDIVCPVCIAEDRKQ